MEFQDLVRRAMDVRRQYADFEKRTYGRAWTREELVQGFVGDVGDLVKLTMAQSGIRNIPDVEQKLAHELADCLWSVLVLSELYGVDLEQTFLQTMNELEQHIAPQVCQERGYSSGQPSSQHSDEAGAPQVLGADGARDIQNGHVTGTDPLSPYGDPYLRAAQLLRVAQFPHAGDLIVNSPQYPDGQVAAYEELIGSHGGMGGQQTDAFLFHPADMVLPPISNAAELFSPLNARRGLPGKPLEPQPAPAKAESWSLETLLAGVRAGNIWAPRAVRALLLDRAVFREVAADPFSTGPALLILLIVFALQSLIAGLNPDTPGSLLIKAAGNILGVFTGWMIMVLLAHVAGRWLSSGVDLTRTMRSMAFAAAPRIVGVLSPLPWVGPLFSVAAVVMGLVAMWMAVQEALGLKESRMALIPIAGLLVIVITTLVISVTFSGVALTAKTILAGLGIWPGPYGARP